MPRSGTTWLGKIFDSHPDTLYKHEPDDSRTFAQIPLFPDKIDTEYSEKIARFVNQLPFVRTTKVAATLPTFEKSYLNRIQFQWYNLSVLIAKFGAKAFGEFPVLYPYNNKNILNTKIVWKSIESLGRFGTIVEAVPNCNAILMIRHPCGYIASVIKGESKNKFSARDSITNDKHMFSMLCETEQAKSLGFDLTVYERSKPVERLAWLWLVINGKALEESRKNDKCMVVRYEDICENPVQSAKNMFTFTGLSWSEQTEDFLTASSTQNKSGYYSVFKDSKKSAYKWRDELSAKDIELVNEIIKNTEAGQLYSEQGFETEQHIK
jgi:hypothetical protein